MTVAVQAVSDPITGLIRACCGQVLTPKEEDIFNYCQVLGDVYSGFVDGVFVCCWGLIPPTYLSNQAYLWMWAPEPIPHQLVFIRRSQIQVAKMLERYERIVGHCDIGALSAQRWLRWLGAEFGQAEGHLLPFTIHRRQ